MKFQRPLLVFGLLLTAAFGIALTSGIWHDFHRLRPTSDTESSFLKNYTPERVIELFRCKLPSASLNSKDVGAGFLSITHTSGFLSSFVMRSEKRMHFMTALNDDVSTKLLMSGAHIQSQSGDALAGFSLRYKLGHSIGTVTILPLVANHSVRRGAPLPGGTEDVDAHIVVKEEWFPKQPTS